MKWAGRRRKGLLLQRQSTSQRNEWLDSKKWDGHKVDDPTGQVFTEKTTPILSASDRYWSRTIGVIRSPSSVAGWKGIEPKKVSNGVPSLQRTALQSILENVVDLTPDSIVNLPTPLTRRIWDSIRDRCNISLETWQLFSQYLHGEDGIDSELLRYNQVIELPRLRLAGYTTPLASDAFAFVTSLSISTSFPLPDLIRLASLRNLGVLEILNETSQDPSSFQLAVGDRLIRAWHLAASETHAFPILRVMRLWNFDGVTNQSLAYLNAFPSLAVFDVQGCGFNKDSRAQARQLGWELCLGKALVDLFGDICAKRAAVLRNQVDISSDGCPFERLNNGIRRIPRSQVPAFLAGNIIRNETTKTNKKKELAGETDSKPLKTRKAKELKAPLKVAGSWSNELYKAYTQIGELRNDSDLGRVGATIYDQAIKGDELWSSVPVASLRLGPSIPIHPSVELFFLRIKAPSAEVVTQEEASGKVKVESVVSADNISSSQGSVNTKPGTGKMRMKKRKLDDVLGSFA